MLFNSLSYLLFMLLLAPLVVFGPPRVRQAVLLFGGIIFYAFWRVDFTLLVLFTAFVDWYGGLRIYYAKTKAAKRIWMTISLVMNLSVLGFFKYFYFVVGTTQSVVSLFGGEFELDLPFRIILPLGISFYTFHSLSYVFDMYRGLIPPIQRYTQFITYVMFWTQLVAGPILRAHEIVPQLENYQRPTRGEVVHGLEEILQGLFKKLALADTIAQIVDEGFAIPVSQMGTLDVWTLAFAFGFQIYFDFSGYSQIALGSARVMGFHFPPNFVWPYLAVSPREFWNRWHISLSSWIRDYLYVPLQGVEFRRGDGLGTEGAAQASEGRRTFALFATWFIMGLWHGANWTFAIWGLWHASMVYVHRVSEPLRVRLPIAVRVYGGWLITVPMAMLGWVYFRSPNVGDATRMVLTAFDPTRLGVRAMRENDYLITFLFMAGFLLVAGAVALSKRLGERVPALPYPVLAAANAVMVVFTFLLLGQLKSFIYFQF